jgi:predicted amidohydrolase
MQDIKVTLIQADQIWEDKSANFSMYENYFRQISETDIIILPEMFHTGFSMSVDQLAEDWQDSSGIDFLKKWSKQLQSAIYTSLIIREAGKIVNRGVFVFPDGSISTYDKRKSFGLGGEDQFFTAGEKETIVTWRGWKINLQICYDLRFPELIRNRMEGEEAEYDLLLYVANWPEKRISHWDTLLQARAIENQCYVIGVNRVGTDGKGLIYSGGTVIYDMLGQRLNSARNNQAEIVFSTLPGDKLMDTRKTLPFLKDCSIK